MKTAAITLVMAAGSLLGLEAQEQLTELDTLRVQVVSRVDANVPASTRTVQLLSAAEITALPVRTVSELLEWATGVDVLSRSPAQGDLSIRGAAFEQVVVMVNGVRMSDPQTGHFDLDLAVPLEMVERVEVLRGAASALYGADAMGGVVNVVTRSGETPFSGSVQGGSWGTARVSVRGGVSVGGDGGEGGEGGFDISAGGEATRSDGHREGTDYETTLLHLTLTHLAAGGRVRGEVGASRRDFGAQDFYAAYPSYEKTRHYTATIGWSSTQTRTLVWEARISARKHDDDFTLVRDDPSLYRNRHTSSQAGGTVLGRYSSERGRKVAFGGEVFIDILRSTNLGDRSESRGALFAEALLGKPGSAVLSLGARSDWHQRFGSFISPSISGSVFAHHGFRLRAAVGRSFRAPTWTERYYEDPVNIGWSDLLPERAWSAEFGIDFERSSSFTVSTTVFGRRATSLIDWARPVSAGDTTPWETRNVETATFRGLEADLAFLGPLGLSWTLGGTALVVDADVEEGYRSKYALRPLREQLTVGVERTIGSRAAGRIRLRHARREGEDSYQRLDFRLSVRVGIGWLHLDGLNILDAEYPDVTGARAPGRALFVGYSLARG